jgi:uncharacterized delta-60 repeat protein
MQTFLLLTARRFFCGSILVCLAFIHISARPGDLDTTFHSFGYVSAGFGGGSGRDWSLASVMQPDGKLVLVGYNGGLSNILLERFNIDGSLDVSFGENGVVQTPYRNGLVMPSVASLAPNGKILIAGWGTVVNYEGLSDPWPILAAYDADGTLDLSFGTGGILTLAERGYPVAMSILSDGKIVIVYSGRNGDQFRQLIRLNGDGSYDTTFGSDGGVPLAPGFDGAAFGTQPDGKMLLGGAIGGTSAVMRLNADGSPDIEFANGGILNEPWLPAYVQTIQIRPDGKLLVLESRCLVFQLNPDGSYDNSFGNGGGSWLVPCLDPAKMILQSDGTTVLMGGTNTPSVKMIMRITSAGTTDTSFGNYGATYFQIGTNLIMTNSMSLDPSGGLLVSGWFEPPPDPYMAGTFFSKRFSSSGIPDTSYGLNGTAIGNVSDSLALGSSMRIQSDGKVLIAGVSGLMRFDEDGSLDRTFNGTGKISIPGDYGQHALDLQPDGKIVFAVPSLKRTHAFSVVRFLPDGSNDNTFGGAGRVTNSFGPTSFEASALTVQSDGKIVAAGGDSGIIALARYNDGGSLDESFGKGGKVLRRVINATADYGVFKVAQQPDGKLIVASNYEIPWPTPNWGIGTFLTRFNADGSLDTTFNGSGFLLSNLTRGGVASDLKIQSDGKIVMAGHIYPDWEHKMRFFLVRVNSDGSYDQTFNGSGLQTVVATTDPFIDASAGSVVIQPDGKYLIAGRRNGRPYSDNWQVGEQDNETILFRLLPDGSLDNFGSGRRRMVALRLNGGNRLMSAELDQKGRIVLGGMINSLYGVARLQNEIAGLPLKAQIKQTGSFDLTSIR